MKGKVTRTLLGLGFIAGMCIGAYKLAITLSQAQLAKKPRYESIKGLAVESSSLDIGEVWEDKGVVCQLPIYNLTATPIQIIDFKSGCNCAEITPRTVTVPGNGRVTVEVKLDLTHRTQDEVGMPVRTFSVEVAPVVKTREQRHQAWQLRGSVKSRITLDTLSLRWGESLTSGLPGAERKVIATAHVPVDRLEVVGAADVATTAVKRLEGIPRQFEISVIPRPSLPLGPFKSTVACVGITAGYERLPGVAFEVAGQVQPQVRPLPARLLLGSQAVGVTAVGYVVLQTISGTEVKVEQIETSSERLDVEAAVIEGSPPGRTFRVTQRVTEEGDHSSKIRFVFRKADGTREHATMEVSYYGQVARLPLNEKEARR